MSYLKNNNKETIISMHHKPIIKFISITLIFFLNSCLVPAKSIVYENINDLSALSEQVKLDKPDNLNTLIIFDIDDTLLESVNFVGSGKWYNWQRGRIVYDADGGLVSVKKDQQFHCMFRTLGTLFEIGSTKLTQDNAVEIFNQFKNFDLMILTARTAKYRVATERELAKHGIVLADEHFSSVKDGLDFEFNDSKRTARVTYNKGIVMSSGLNKGRVLKTILEQANKKYESIYFIDDSDKNVKQMKQEWQDKASIIKIFHYTKVDKTVNEKEIAESDEAKQHYHQFLKVAYPDQYEAFSKGDCD